MVIGLVMVPRLVIRYITAMQTLPHITQALTPPSPYHLSPAVTHPNPHIGPVLVHMGPVVL
jgi:hypothetical protein